MSDNKTSKKNKGFFLWRWLRRMFMGASKELTVADERYDSPSKLAVKRFFRKPLATGAVIILLLMFMFVFIGPIIAPVDLTDTGKEDLHRNVGPTMSMMKIPSSMKSGDVQIASKSTFTLGLDKDGKVHVWGYYYDSIKGTNTDVTKIPDEVKNAKIAYIAASDDHCIAISEEGKVYGWGNYMLAQYGKQDSTPYFCTEEPDELINGTIDVSQVRQLVCGVRMTALLMEDGTLYAWGNDMVTAKNLSSVRRELKEKGTIARNVAFTSSAIYVVDSEGELITGDSKTLDYFSVKNSDGSFTQRNTLEYIGERKIVDLKAIGSALCILLDDGEIICPGYSDPLPVLREGESYESISVGTRHFTGVTNTGRVVAWGQSYRGQCNIPKALTEENSVDTVISAGFQNYAYKDGELVGKWGLNGYLMGTDDLGRDVFNRIMNGGRMTMTIGAVAVIVSTIIGVIVGCISGYFGGVVDMFLMRVTEIFGAIPFLPFALVLSAILQASDLKEDTRIFIIMVILGVLSWTGLAKLIRGQILAEREKEFVTAAKAMGIKERRIAFKHILPNIISVILVTLTLDFAGCMLTESSLSYLGFGVQLPRPTWGNMLDGAKNALVIQSFWWRWVFPALFLSVVTICINIIGDTLRDVLDPKSEVEK